MKFSILPQSVGFAEACVLFFFSFFFLEGGSNTSNIQGREFCDFIKVIRLTLSLLGHL